MKNFGKNLLTSLYHFLCKSFPKKDYSSTQIKLKKLYPHENREKILEQYQIKKISAIIVVIIIGVVSIICSALCSRSENKLAEGNRLIRKSAGSGKYAVMLQAETNEWKKDISFQVDAKQLTTEERDKLLTAVRKELPDIMKGQNEDLNHISTRMNLVSSIKDYPFQISWKSGDYHKISPNGMINNSDIPREGEEITLSAILYDGKESVQIDYIVRLLPEDFNSKKYFFSQVEKELIAENKEKSTNQQITLPQKIMGKEITWTEKRSNDPIWIILCTIGGIVVICFGMDRDLDNSLNKRSKQICKDYPECVSKMRLYLSAGLTIRKTMFKMAIEYQSREHKQKKYLYEEMLIACSQLENGFIEEKVYEDWGKRCGEMRVKRLGFLLSVYAKKGNAGLLEMLVLEAQGAQDDQRNHARKLGEEAGTKLLLPMAMMLVIVMFIILLPAWLGFGQI